ncbi:MAG TPA: hypothetical protein VF526_21215 [Solirubrobacteraceae bacterium]
MVLTGALVAGGAGAAVAAISKDHSKQAEQSILDKAAKRLNVTPDALRSALAAAQDEQLDQAVKDGLLTQKQADAIKARRKQDGRVLGGPFGEPGGPRGPRGPGGPGFKRGPGFEHHRGAHVLFEDLAKSLDLAPAKLFAQLRAGKSVADVAKAQGKSLQDVRSAVKAAAKDRADKAVKSGDITQAQADEMLSHLDDALQNLDKAMPFFRRRGLREGPPRMPSAGNRPGNFVPTPSPGAVFD